ncbi:uncharacterized protein [Miscanthus floridulus]|uniref:uncharacterized protein n=1 Tax=Miscanthus floridulus TaxID=154761 RepID=UPI003457D3C9
MVPGAPARSLTPLGGGGGVPGPVVARPGAEAGTPEARVSEERAVGPMGSTVEVERVTVGATPLSPRRVEEVPGSDGDQLALVDTEAALLPPPPPLQRRRTVSKRLHPRSRQTLLVGDPPLAPRKALKVNVSSSAHQAAEAQAGVRRGAASGEAVSEEAAAQEQGAEAAAERVEEEAAQEQGAEAAAKEAGASAIAEATEGEAGAPKTSDVRAVDAEAIKVEMAEARALGSVETEAMEVETGQILAPPLVQTISSDDSSRGKEAADVEAASTAEQPVPDPAEGSSALVRLRPEPRGWNFPRVFWRNRADPEGEPVFALEDTAEGWHWDTLEQYRQLAVRSLQTAMTIMGQDLPGVTRIWRKRPPRRLRPPSRRKQR